MKQDVDSEAGVVRVFLIWKAPSLKIIFNLYYKLSFYKDIFPVTSQSTLCVIGGKLIDSWVIIFHLCRISTVDDNSESPSVVWW